MSITPESTIELQQYDQQVEPWSIGFEWLIIKNVKERMVWCQIKDSIKTRMDFTIHKSSIVDKAWLSKF